MQLSANDTILLALCLIILWTFYARKKYTATGPYPPGPRKYPFLANLLDIPTSFEWETYARWGKEYNSGILHLCAAGHDIIILNSYEAAIELLERRSSVYSSRPQFTMITELMGYNWLLPMLVYGQAWKDRRRLFQKYFSNRNVAVYRATQAKFVRKLLPRLLLEPQNFLELIQHMTGGTTISLAYGLDIQNADDPFVDLATRAIGSVARAGAPGAFLVDFIPWLKYVPEWMPGAGFKRTAKAWRKLQEDVREVPYAEAAKKVDSGDVKPCFVSECLENLDDKHDVQHQIDVIKDTAGVVFATGSDTTLSAIQTFLVAMLYFPEVQQKAQMEIDTVTKGRLPEFSDEKNLPYINALVKEVLRWKPVAPLGLPHYASENDLYEGYFIPQGALVIANAWAMLQDERRYPEPFLFKPERFLREDGQLDETVQDPSLMAFGFGRRQCPGRHVANSLLWLTVASILATFEISRPLGEDGVPVEPSVKYHSGMMHHPLPFDCTLKPRSTAAENLMKSIDDSS